MLRKLQFFIILGIFTYMNLTPHPERFTETTHDKALHLIGYLILFLSVSMVYDFRKRHLEKMLGLFLYSLLIEAIQYFVPNRSFSGLDLAANGIGLISGWCLIVIYGLLSRGYSRLH